MGEIAEMHLDGTLCEMCGEFLDGESPGYPRYCSKQCAEDRGCDVDHLIDLDNQDSEEEATTERVKDELNSAIIWIEMAIDTVKELKLKGRTKELSWLIKRIEQFKEKLPKQ